jgi:putative chitinase
MAIPRLTLIFISPSTNLLYNIKKTDTNMINADTLKRILPSCKDPETWSFELSDVLPHYDITTKERIASFLAQTGHESAHYNILVENLNYSQDGLRKVFPRYFPDDQTAFRYARQPKWIASRVYANRMGNGGEQSLDGWKFRGRGLIQVTGKNNYTRCSNFLFGDDRLLENPDLLLDPKNALLSACWFWHETNLNRFAADVNRTTRLVNGGTKGLADRTAIYQRGMRFL